MGSLKPVAIAAVKALAVATVAAVVLVGGCAALIYSFDEAGGFPWRDASVELRALKGVALRESLGDVARLGTFELDESVPVKGEWSPGRHYIERGNRLAGRLRLHVVGETVTRISYECRRGPDGTRVNRIQCDDPPSRVLEVFGNGARRLCASVTGPSDPRAKMAAKAFAFDVIDTGTRYITLDDRVRGFVVMEPPDLQEALDGDQPWDRCG